MSNQSTCVSDIHPGLASHKLANFGEKSESYAEKGILTNYWEELHYMRPRLSEEIGALT